MLFSNSQFYLKSSEWSFDIKVATYDPILPLRLLLNILKDATARKMDYNYQAEISVLVLLCDYFACQYHNA
jgi:hypothetical protein